MSNSEPRAEALAEMLAASFRDPSGFLFRRADGALYRQINEKYREDYDLLMGSGLYQSLVKANLLVPHEEVDVPPADEANAYKVIRPALVPFISYPYEWSFSQLKNAALATLAIEKRALSFGMSLKDSSAYNIQFYRGKPVLIDTLSFETYEEGKPWVAYRQFCQHFLAPLALMTHRDVRLSQLLRVYIDGVPLDLASMLLPGKTKLNFGLLTHLHAHAAAQQKYAGQAVDTASPRRQMSKLNFQGLLESLEGTVRKLTWKPEGTEWADYTTETHNYTESARTHKETLVRQYLAQADPKEVWDMGANTGDFSRVASAQGIPTLSFDIDPSAVEQNYLRCVAEKETNLLPLVMDLTNPSAAIGWHNRERDALLQRGPVDAALALALIHHLAISNNVPLPHIADFFADLGRWLIIEFVPKHDEQVQKLLASREDIFPNYTQEGFEKAFATRFETQVATPVEGTPRILYLMKRK